MAVGMIGLIGLGVGRLELWGLFAAVSLGAALGSWVRLYARSERNPHGL